MLQSRGVARLLQIHTEINQIQNNLHLPLRLHITAHNAETHKWFSILRYKTRNYRMKRSFVRGVAVQKTILQIKQLAAVLQNKPKAVRRHPGTHSSVVALNQRNHIAVFVRHRKINRISRIGIGIARLKISSRLVRIDKLPAFCCILLRDKLSDGYLVKIRVCVILCPVLINYLFGFEKIMQVFDAAEPLRFQVEAFEDIEHLQNRDSLAVPIPIYAPPNPASIKIPRSSA